MPLRLISQQVLLEHEVLARLADALRTAIGWGQHGDLPRRFASVQFLTDSFQRHLERMFELEEHDGYMDRVPADNADWQTRIAEFRDEHQCLREDLQRLTQRMADSLPEAGIELVFSELQAILDRIDTHNQSETDFLQNVLLHDAGQPPPS